MIGIKELGLGACALVIAAAATPAVSQISPLGPGAFAVPSADLPLAAAAEAKLYDPATKVGANEGWSNAKTGDSGSVTLISTFAREGQACRRVAHVLKVRGIQGERQFVISRCRQSDGSWKIVP
jgi:surface antigen